MAFTLAGSHGTASSAVYNELAAYFNGSGSVPANPIKLITFSDSTQPAIIVKNLDTTNGQVAQFLKADGTILGEFHKTGFRFSPDGVSAGLTPVSISGAETVTGAKTFSAALTAAAALIAQSTLAVTGASTLTGNVALGGRIVWKRGTSTAATASLTLPTDGNLIPITAGGPITSIAVVTGMVVCLEFAAANIKVTKGATLNLDGDFMSAAARATLTLECDGTNWNEIGRAGGFAQSARAPSAGQTLTDGAGITAMTLGSATYDPFTLKSGNTMVVPFSALWRVWGTVVFPASSAGTRIVQVFKNGSVYCEIASFGSAMSATGPHGIPFVIEDRFTAADILDVRVATSGAGSLVLVTRGHLGLTFIANN